MTARRAKEAGLDGESRGISGWPWGGRNRRLRLAPAAVASSPIPASGGAPYSGSVLRGSVGVEEGVCVLKTRRGGLLLYCPRWDRGAPTAARRRHGYSGLTAWERG